MTSWPWSPTDVLREKQLPGRVWKKVGPHGEVLRHPAQTLPAMETWACGNPQDSLALVLWKRLKKAQELLETQRRPWTNEVTRRRQVVVQ